MPQSSRRLRQRRNEAAHHARAMESNEARAVRLTRDTTRVTRRRAAETDEERTARLADNTEREARRRAAEGVILQGVMQKKSLTSEKTGK